MTSISEGSPTLSDEVLRPRIYEQDLHMKNHIVRFDSRLHIIPMALTAYGDVLYGGVGVTSLATNSVSKASVKFSNCVTRCPLLVHKNKKIEDELQDLNQQSYKIGKVVFLVRSGVETLLDNLYSEYTQANKEAILALLLEHGEIVFTQEGMNAFSPSPVRDCAVKLERVNADAQNLVSHMQESMQQMDLMTEECTTDIAALDTAACQAAQAFLTLTSNYTAYLDVKHKDNAIDDGKIDKRLDFETRMAAFEDAKVQRMAQMEAIKINSAKAMLDIEKERALLQRAPSKDEDPTLTTFTINELCKKHRLLDGIEACHYFEIFKRSGELSAIEHKAKEWKFAERRDGKSNAYPKEYEEAKLQICKQVIAQFRAKQLAKIRRQAATDEAVELLASSYDQ
jgi:hypothetical protein